jgi:non-ribosomal peptide synthetase component F
VERDASRNPLFDVMFAFQNMDMAELQIPGLKLSPYNYEVKTAKFDMLLAAAEVGDCISFNLSYSTKLFKKSIIERYVDYFKHIISLVVRDLGVK